MLLTQNSELKRDGVWNWTLPAWVVELPDGSHFNVCPHAGACAKFCYARNGTYLFPKVRGKHLRNLELVKDDPQWTEEIAAELEHKKFRPTMRPRHVPGLFEFDHLNDWVRWWLNHGGQAVRVHDSGDFFSEDYLYGWIEIAWRFPDVLFYAYTKEVSMLKEAMGKELWPANFLICFSMGGREDHLLDLEVDRHADVFPDLDAIEVAGYRSQDLSDLLCVLLPGPRIGIPQNNIPHFKKRLDGRTFAEAQLERRR
jgi:hypothetical protein